MSLEELALFNELFTSRFGICFPEHKREILETRLLPRLRANHVQRFLDYYLLLQYDLQKELDPLVRAITNNESYFFREVAQIKALSNDLLESLVRGGTPGRLRVLSAGCSSGEEPYTINILLRSTPGCPVGEDLAIDGIDLDSERLEMARVGEYRHGSLRALDDAQRDRYFDALENEVWSLKPSARQGVSIRGGNILDVDSFPRIPYDVVFCRNVLIYFSESSLKKAIGNFARAVRPGGVLFLGHSESIIGLTQSFQAERLVQCIGYRRTEK